MCRRRFDLLAAEVVARVPCGSAVLEIGPSYGYLLLVLKRLGYVVQATETDETLASGECDALFEAGVPVRRWDLHTSDSPFRGRSFDLVICSEVIEHLQISVEAAL